MKSRGVVVVGASGKVGTHLIAMLLKSGYSDITAVIRRKESVKKIELCLQYYNLQNNISDLNIAIGDADDYCFMVDTMRDRAVVYNCAATVSFSRGDGQTIVRNNVRICSVLAEAAKSVELPLMVHVGSIAALDDRRDPVQVDSMLTTIEGHTPYGVSKFYSEAVMERLRHSGVDVVSVLPSVILSRGEWRGSDISRLFPMVDRGFGFVSEGVTGYVDVEDVARAMVVLSETKACYNQRFLLNGYNLSFGELFSMLALSLGRRVPKLKLSTKILQILTRIITKMENLGIRPPIDSLTVKSLYRKRNYDGAPITQACDFSYTPIQETLNRIALQYKKSPEA